MAMYAEALEAMTASRDLYREATERAHEALAAYRESAEAAPAAQPPSGKPAVSPFQQLARTLERFKGGPKASARPAATDHGEGSAEGAPSTGTGLGSEPGAERRGSDGA